MVIKLQKIDSTAKLVSAPLLYSIHASLSTHRVYSKRRIFHIFYIDFQESFSRRWRLSVFFNLRFFDNRRIISLGLAYSRFY
jgi:hypothetical protein